MFDDKTQHNKSIEMLQMLNRLARSISSTLEVQKILEIVFKMIKSQCI